MTLSFIGKIDEYKAEHQAHINNKANTINELEQKVINKQSEIDKKQLLFNAAASEDLFQNLLKLKSEIQTMKTNVKSAGEIITIPDMRLVTNEEIAIDLDEFINSLELKALKNNIAAAKQNFLDSIDIFDKKVKEIKALKFELAELNIDKQFVLKTLEAHKDLYDCNEEIAFPLPVGMIDNTRRAMNSQAADIYISKF